jgi:hypothetical protein
MLVFARSVRMIEYFTALVLHYEVQGKELETVVWF